MAISSFTYAKQLRQAIRIVMIEARAIVLDAGVVSLSSQMVQTH
jgi:hypothetical protein